MKLRGIVKLKLKIKLWNVIELKYGIRATVYRIVEAMR